MKGILGRKLGMTQVFTEEGTLIPVTVVEMCIRDRHGRVTVLTSLTLRAT